MPEDLILRVDKNDKVIGEVSKDKAHQGKGILHRAFLAIVFNENNQLLLAQRSKFKKLWSGFWDGSVASHFKKGDYNPPTTLPIPPSHSKIENFLKRAVKKRIVEELGVEPREIKYLFKFHFKVPFKNIGSENEICYVFKVKVGSKISPSPEEVSNWKWVGLSELKKNLNKNSTKYTPWFRIAIKQI